MEPDWTFLPQYPRRFFGLESDAQLRELKRAYGRLIKRYKPDTHQEEFMRIRAAYEELEGAIAYGIDEGLGFQGGERPAEAPARPRPESGPILPKPVPLDPKFAFSLRNPKPAEAESPPAPPSYAERLWEFARSGRGEVPPELEPRTGDDFIRYAFYVETLEDERKGEARFFQVLVKGLSAFPHFQPLRQCLRSFFAHLNAAETVAHFLEQARWRLDPREYFFITEEAWFRLAELAGEEAAANLLKDFTRDAPMSATLVVFLRRFVKRHYNRIELGWFEQTLIDISEFLGPGGVHDDLEFQFLETLLVYRQMPPEQWDAYPVLHEVDRLLALICQDGASRQPIQIYRFYRRLAGLDYTCANFAGRPAELFPAYRILRNILNLHFEIFGELDEQRQLAGVDPENLDKLGRRVNERLDQAVIGCGTEEDVPLLAIGGSLLIGVAAYVQLGGWMGSLYWAIHYPLAILAALYLAWVSFGILCKVITPDSEREGRSRLWEVYEESVRPVLIDYMKSHQLDYADIYLALAKDDQIMWLNQRRPWIGQFFAQDMPLAFHSLGLRLVSN